ncbi:MAG: sodium:solute symporter [Acidobacteria bacterium]|nr:MAG: sodium:solute symporter [Acidobacteriota bacterium]PYQ87687.1 MAG: sodium:solute symporter [Acidobacteriota bacterium]PYQ91912.1 MAG: sodium:solute symporter [Acidobacteriota bacterium]
MRPLDWAVVIAYIAWVIVDGLRRSKATDQVDGYLLANRSLPWWAVGLSVMATQMSAVTIVSTTGLGYLTGLRFVQFYFGLPLAMVILSVTVVPFFTRARVYTAYEYLERRFDAKTRSLASLLFLVGRAASLGVTLAAPSVVMSAILGWTLPVTVLVICVPMIVYTTFGGVQAVAWTDVKQMFIVVFGMLAAVAILLYGIVQHVGLGQALHLAGASGRLHAIDFNVNLTERYTFWSGMIGGLFLMLSYFGCDQSQVQRYLSAKSIDEARHSLMMSAYVKIPLQLLILGTGVLLFVYYLFQTPPMLFNRVYDDRIAGSAYAADYAALQQEFDRSVAARRGAAERGERTAFLASDARLQGVRARAVALVKQASGDENYNDSNYIFPTFVTTRMPVGLVGLLIGAIFVAAMSASGGELNALATATIIDFYRRHFVTSAPEQHYVHVSKIATVFWGLFACVVAMRAAGQGSLIEVVNRYGSFVYGSLLGVFILAILTPRATARGAFIGLIAGMAAVLTVAIELPWIEFLWHNLIGAVVVVVVGLLLS